MADVLKKTGSDDELDGRIDDEMYEAEGLMRDHD
jgi:hypothetical protein